VSLGADAAEPAKPELPSAALLEGSPARQGVETEFQKLESDDDAAQADVDKWKRENAEAKTKGAGLSETEFEARIRARFEPVRKAYDEFLDRHPNHAKAHLAYGCFLNEQQDETGARTEWEKALELDPQNSAIYNNLAGSYSEAGPASKAFDYFNKAIALKPTEASYYHNFGTTLYVLRKSGAKYYGVDEQAVFAKVIQLYSNAVRLDRTNFSFATDLAQTYYSLKPLPIETALVAWTNALQAARQGTQREDVLIHLARVKMLDGHLAEARALVTLVTNQSQQQLKANLIQAIEAREHPSAKANSSTALQNKQPQN
jgi:Tfp pilus assembly protein PilF